MFGFIKNIKKWINNMKQNKIEKTMYDISAEIVRRDAAYREEGLSDDEIIGRHKFSNIDEYNAYIRRCKNFIKCADMIKIAKMFHKGYSIDKIVKLTGFSEDTIREMANDIRENWGIED